MDTTVLSLFYHEPQLFDKSQQLQKAMLPEIIGKINNRKKKLF